MLEIVMMVIYAVTFIIAITRLFKTSKTSYHEIKEEIIEFRRDITSMIVIIYKVVSEFVKSPILLIALAMLSASMLLSAISTQYSLTVISRDIGPTNTYAIYIGFRDLIPIEDFKRLLNISELECMKFYIRYVLDRRLELLLDDARIIIYALVGVPTNYTLGDVVIGDNIVVVGISKPVNTTLNIGGDSFTFISVDPKLIENVKIFYEIPLLPVEAYLGVKPITVPPDKTLITTTLTITKLVHLDKYSITDVVIELSSMESYDVEVFRELLQSYKPVVMVLKDSVLEILSSYGLPTKESLISALISASISSIALSVTFTALQPKVRVVYSRLSILGLHSWSLSVSLTILIALILLTLGGLMVVVINRLLGMYSALNSFITFITSYVVTLIFINRKVFSLSVVEVVPTPISTKFNIMVRDVDACIVLEKISNLLKNDEFFELMDLDVKCEGVEGFLHASCRFRGAWGIGLDLDILTGRYGREGLELSFNISTWSVEELSEKQLESVLRLFTSKLIGGIKVWALG